MPTNQNQRSQNRDERTPAQIERNVQDHIDKNQSLYQSWFDLARATQIDDSGALAGVDQEAG